MKIINIILTLTCLQISNAYGASPEFYGIYASNNNELIEMVKGDNKPPYDFNQKVQFLVFQKQAELFVNSLTIERAIFVRSVNNPGLDRKQPPKNLNTWKPRRNGVVEIRTKPVAGQTEQIYVVPRAPLPTGMYIVSMKGMGGEIGRFYVDKNQVTKNLERGEDCIDIVVEGGWASYQYDLGGGGGKSIPCLSITTEDNHETEIENKGAERFKDNANGTLTDINSGIMWTKNTDLGSENTQEKAIKLVQKLNDQKYAGYSDWRLPTIDELGILVKFARDKGLTIGIPEYGNDRRRDPYLNELFYKIGFKNMKADNYYWSTSSRHVAMDGYGGINSGLFLHVWPVRNLASTTEAPSTDK